MQNIKLLIAGGREFDNYPLLSKYCDKIREHYNIIEIISGTARGADRLGERYAMENNIPIKRFPADWNIGKSAGYIRNKKMGEYCTNALIFWDCKSRGTKHMISIMKSLNKKFLVVEYEEV